MYKKQIEEQELEPSLLVEIDGREEYEVKKILNKNT